MLTRMRLENFKSWRDTGSIRLAPITGFFGANSSGKTSLLQALLLLKQTAESTDRNIVIQFGSKNSIINLGGFMSVIHHHNRHSSLNLHLNWRQDRSLEIRDPLNPTQILVKENEIGYHTYIGVENGDTQYLRPSIYEMHYSLGDNDFGLSRDFPKVNEYILNTNLQGFQFMRVRGRAWSLPEPPLCYNFPDQVRAYYQNAGFLFDLAFALEEQLGQIHYLGPLRAAPERSYTWSGTQPSDMGRAGEQAIDAILASRDRQEKISRGKGKKRLTLEEYVAHWLKELGLISEFKVKPVSQDSRIFEVLVKKTPTSPEVLLTDVGFGVSQILPVLVLLFYVPEGSTVILEQPEIHLHPSVQMGLADVIIDAYKKRNVQVIIESHSEHLLRRLQRRIAEEFITKDDASLYFCKFEQSESTMIPLDMDEYGNIKNWPTDFFADQFGEVATTQKRRIERMRAASKK